MQLWWAENTYFRNIINLTDRKRLTFILPSGHFDPESIIWLFLPFLQNWVFIWAVQDFVTFILLEFGTHKTILVDSRIYESVF